MKYNTPQIHNNSSFSKRAMTWTLIFLVPIFAILAYSETAHASLFSYMVSLFGGEASATIVTERSYANSQTITLLQPAVNHDPNPEKSSGTAPIVGSTLVADIALSETAPVDGGNTQISSYIVRDGDTLSGIAKMFGVSVNTIVWANDINRASGLRVGQTIVILPVTGISYTIAKGDTIKGIASRYKADVDEILRYNDLTLESTIVVGRNIIIPDAEIRVVVPTRTVSAGVNIAHDTNVPEYSGYYDRPISGGTKTQGLHGYNAVDLAAPVGTPIYASASGKVIVSATGGWNGGYGNMVIISHANGTQTVYAHNSKNLVVIGQYVEKGQKIALMGATGKSTGSHVHFEIRGAKNPF